MRSMMRTRAHMTAGAMLLMLLVALSGMMVAGCEKRTAGKTERQAPGNAGEKTAPDVGKEQPASPTTQPPADVEKPATQVPTNTAEKPAAIPDAKLPAGSETRKPAGSEQPPPAGGTQTSAGDEPQSPGEPQAPADTAGKAAPPAAQDAARFKYAGVAACSMCHKGAAKGSIYEVWLASPHAKAFEKLGPADQKNEVCLACHTTGYGKALAANVTPQKMLNVQCEACHGPGSEYKILSVMKSRPAALEKGLILPTKEVCLGCHGGRFPQGHPTVAFNYESALLKIEHHSKPTEPAK